MTCARCGADAVDAHGLCQACGWQASSAAQDDSSPSLGETRAADVAAPRPARSLLTGTRGRGAPASGPQGAERAAGGPLTHGGTGGTRYCGACGAPIEPGHAYCGQCGVAVAPVAGGERGATAAPSGPRGSATGLPAVWAGGNDEPTEEFADVPPPLDARGYARSGLYGPQSGAYGAYRASGGGAGAPAIEPPAGGSRTLRLTLGIICLVGSIASAVAAIILALATFR